MRGHESIRASCPGRGATRSVGTQTRDRTRHRVSRDPGSAAHRFALRCARDTKQSLRMTALWTTDDMAAAMRAEKSGALPAEVSGISIDSRSMARGEAFF